MAPSSQMSLPMPSLSEVARHGSPGSRGRKMAPSGGNRSWSEEEVSDGSDMDHRMKPNSAFRKTIFCKLERKRCHTSISQLT